MSGITLINFAFTISYETKSVESWTVIVVAVNTESTISGSSIIESSIIEVNTLLI